MFIVSITSVIVQINCHISQFSRQMFSVSTPLTNGTINQMLRQFASLSNDCRELSTLIDHLLKGPKQHNRPNLSPGCLVTIGQA